MGVSRSPRELAAKFDRLGKALANDRAALEKTGMRGKQIFLAAAASAGVLGSKVAGKRKAIGARYDFTKDHGLIVTYTGPAHLVANPTRPHRIEPRRPRGSRTRRRRGAAALTINGALRAWAQHPGTPGKDFFSRAQAIAKKELPKVYAQAQLTEPVRRIFG